MTFHDVILIGLGCIPGSIVFRVASSPGKVVMNNYNTLANVNCRIFVFFQRKKTT